MTSWTKRIQYVAKAIFRFMKTQTVKPDIFYLWLAEEEFPHKEKDLPSELLIVCEAFNIQLKWTKDNEYAFKRYHVYPMHYDDLVIVIDEDQIYDKDLIKDAKEKHYDSNTSYNIFSGITLNIEYDGSGIGYKRIKMNSDKPSLFGNLNGCHIYPPKTFPLEAITPENEKIRKIICKKCDESWILPWIKFIDGKTTYLNTKSKVNLIPEDKSTAMHTSFTKVINGARKRDIQLYFVLRTFPKLMEKWKKLYPKMNTKKWDVMTDYEIMKLLTR